ncbi:hypothetical protein SDC9_135769 [bioreactor metagenome]|uniref:Uncharacterized protein n=1 Tax=bioreactor metagenome TaxID=1076179 RepID=A0A645DHH9_9ZZZZ
MADVPVIYTACHENDMRNKPNFEKLNSHEKSTSVNNTI